MFLLFPIPISIAMAACVEWSGRGTGPLIGSAIGRDINGTAPPTENIVRYYNLHEKWPIFKCHCISCFVFRLTSIVFFFFFPPAFLYCGLYNFALRPSYIEIIFMIELQKFLWTCQCIFLIYLFFEWSIPNTTITSYYNVVSWCKIFEFTFFQVQIIHNKFVANFINP